MGLTYAQCRFPDADRSEGYGEKRRRYAQLTGWPLTKFEGEA